LLASPAGADPAVLAQAAGAGASGGASGPALRRSTRMEFDARLVKGERASGAVYLFHRVSRRLPPLLKLHRDELDRIVMPVLRRPADPIAGIPEAAPRKDKGAKKKRVRKIKKKAVSAGADGDKAAKKKRKRKKKKKRKKRKKKDADR